MNKANVEEKQTKYVQNFDLETNNIHVQFAHTCTEQKVYVNKGGEGMWQMQKKILQLMDLCGIGLCHITYR